MAADRAALVALYESAGGERWIDSTNWLSDRPLGEWHGVYTDRDGRVEYIALFSNGLAGPIPPEIGQITALIELHLGSNEHSGSLPSELGKLTNLTDLSLYYNSLSGELPRELGHLARLERLSLIGNALSGAIPPEFGALANLVELSLLRNGLSGPIPGELGNLARLERLDLAGNRLSGPIPPELGNLGRLSELYLNDNRLSRTVPRELTALPLTFFWWSGNPGLCIADTAVFAEWVSSIGSYTRIALVAGEPALLRVFPTAERAASARPPAVRADFYLKGTLAHSVDIAAGPGPIPTEIEEGSLDRSANAAIPAEVVQPGLEMAIEIDPQGMLDDSLGVARRIPESGRLAVEVRSMPVFDVIVVPFVWETNPDMSVVELVRLHSDIDGYKLCNLMRASSVANRHWAGVPQALRRFAQAVVCSLTVSVSGKRRFRH